MHILPPYKITPSISYQLIFQARASASLSRVNVNRIYNLRGRDRGAARRVRSFGSANELMARIHRAECKSICGYIYIRAEDWWRYTKQVSHWLYSFYTSLQRFEIKTPILNDSDERGAIVAIFHQVFIYIEGVCFWITRVYLKGFSVVFFILINTNKYI